MLDEKAGFEIHTISKVEKDTSLHVFERRDTKNGKLIRYRSTEPLQVYVPVDPKVQEDLLAGYKTSIGETEQTGVTGAIARFSLHDLESYFGGMKSELAKNATLDDAEAIQEKVLEWTPWAGYGSRKPAKPKADRSKLEELEGDTDAIAAYLASIGVDI